MPKVALVTGGNRGIGLGITRSLLAEGYAVAILATREEPAELLAELRAGGGDVIYVQGSVAEAPSHQALVDAAVAKWGRIDLLVNNAGVAPSVRADVLDADAESFDRVLGINLRGPYFLTQLVAKKMIELRDSAAPAAQAATNATGADEASSGVVGTIVNVSSVSATTVSINRGDYCISKAGVAMATQLWATRLAPEGIVVYEVRPGLVPTDMNSTVTGKYDALIEQGLVPMNRWGTTQDVGGAVVQLAAGRMPYSTGEIINVAGGMQIPRL